MPRWGRNRLTNRPRPVLADAGHRAPPRGPRPRATPPGCAPTRPRDRAPHGGRVGDQGPAPVWHGAPADRGGHGAPAPHTPPPRGRLNGPWPSLPPAGRIPGPCPISRPAGHGAPTVPPARPDD